MSDQGSQREDEFADENHPELDDEEDGEDVEEEVEEDDEEEEDIEEIKKKRKKRRMNPFIEDEAGVDEDEDDEEEEEGEEGYEELGHIDDEEAIGKSRHRLLDVRKRKDEEEDAEAVAARMKAKYGAQNVLAEAFKGDVDHVPQNVLIPSLDDPKLWLISCKPGKEKNIVFNLLRKLFDMEKRTTQMQIHSCFFRESIPGYIYVEAYQQAHVISAVQGMANIYASKIRLVPVNEMVDCLTIKIKPAEIKIGAWVRMKRGKYSGDLGQVLEVSEIGDTATIKLIPRLDMTKDSAASKRKKGGIDIRPPQKLFHPDDVNKREVSYVHGGCSYQGEFFDKDGYLEKSLKISSLDTKQINPTLEEITKFSGGVVNERGDDLALLAKSNLAIADDFHVGESVLAISGEVKGLFGVVKSIIGSTVSIIPDKSFNNTRPVQISASELSKRFREGDHVKVANGVHADETGLVVKVSDNTVTLLSDTTLKTDLKAAAEVSTAQISSGQYDIQDLVTLSPTEVGVIIKAEKDSFSVLNQYGNIIKVHPQQIKGRRDSSRAITSDRDGKPITTSDSVVVMDAGGHGVKKRANVLHVYRSYIFLQSREVPENGGIFVTGSQNVAIMNSRAGNQQHNHNVQMNRSVRGRGRGGRSDPMVSKTGRIIKGQWKGYIGIIKDATETHYRVELHSINRTVTIAKEDVSIEGTGVSRGPAFSNAFGSRTSAFDGGKTPAYDSGLGAATPNPYLAAGSRTPAWDAGSKTPAWDAGSKTPAWDAGARTPGSTWGANARTPGSDFNIPYTPGSGHAQLHNADTPLDHAHTPAPITPYPQTPGFPATPGIPQTPGVGIPETPGSGIPSTPAAIPSQTNSSSDHKLFDWVTTDIQVKIIPSGSRSYRDGSLDGKLVVIRKVDNGGRSCTIHLESGEAVNIQSEFLTPVPPEKKQNFKVISGHDRGRIGALLSIDGQEGVVLFERDSNIIMMNLRSLARYIE